MTTEKPKKITIEIKAPELATAIMTLCEVLEKTQVSDINMLGTSPSIDSVENKNPPPVPLVLPEGGTTNPLAAVMPQVPAPIPIEPPQAVALPTAEKTYSLEELSLACTQLMDAGRVNEIHELFAMFGIQHLTALQPQSYGVFAQHLRNKGVNL